MSIKEKTIFFGPIALIMLLVCSATYGFVPKRSIVEDVMIAPDHMIVADKDQNVWKVTTNCNIDTRTLRNPIVDVDGVFLDLDSTITIRDHKKKMQCKVDRLTLL